MFSEVFSFYANLLDGIDWGLFWKYIIAIWVIEVFMICVYWRKVISFLLSMLDLVLFHLFKNKRVFMFKRGWWEDDRYEKMKNYKSTSEPIDVKVKWEKVKMEENRNYIKEIGSFISPLSNLLRDGEERVEFLFATPKGHEGKLAIILPAASQQGYSWRWKNIGRYLVKEKIAVCIPIVPLYKHRKNKTQKECGITYQTVIDSPIVFHAVLEELRSLVKIFEKKFKKICVTGLSMGGCTTFHLANVLSVTENVEVSYVSYLGFKNMMPSTSIKRIIENNLKNFEPPKDFEFKNKKIFSRVCEVIEKFQCSPIEELVKTNKSIKNVVVMEGKFDYVIPKGESKEFREKFEELAKKSEANFDFQEVSCSHFSAFFLQKNLMRRYVKNIVDTLK